MTVKNLVGTLTRTGVSTAVTVARHPLGTAAMAAGVVKGAAEAGVHLVRGTISGETPQDVKEAHDLAEDAAKPAQTVPVEPVAPEPVVEDPRDHIPGPDIVAAAVPEIDELPEPIVIEAEPTPGQLGESFHTEPKASSRDSAHGGPAGGREAEGYLEEIVVNDLDIEAPVGTTGAEVGHTAHTAESDLLQSGTGPLGGPANG